LPCARTRHTTKTFPLPRAVEKRTANIAVRFYLAHGKHICLLCVFPQRTTKYFKNFDFCTSFNFSTTKTLLCTLNFKFIHISINLLFLTIMCNLKNFCRIRQI
jgi:hypothetical protein